MSAPNPLSMRHFRFPGRRAGRFAGRLTRTSLALPAASLVAAFVASLPAAGQGRQDHVAFADAQGQAKSFRGTIQENSLSRVVIVEPGGRERTVQSSAVQRVDFGGVPPSYTEGLAYFDRGDFENAARQFQLAASDASARPVVQAAARLHAARAWMRRGADDANAFGQAKDEAERFLADHPDNREVPAARALLARATWLSGDPAGAAELYRSLYQEAGDQEAGGGKPTTGYSLLDCYAGGLAAARAFLSADDADTARGLFAEISSGLTTVLSSLDEDDPQRLALTSVQSEARLGEGFCLLASGSASQARAYFQRRLDDDRSTSAERYGARLGLAEALLADGETRRAQIEFATVSAVDYTDRDRVARALIGLAECALRLADTDARQDAKLWLQTVRTQFGDTPSVLRAQELSQTL